ncbi:porin family protein [Gelatiniphilus marinus]|uniref:Porin family protein n=1 Tax=Gelatiniphilus marinus TaxID=1759464 RepID=A0ABW5JTC7_9FLAO
MKNLTFIFVLLFTSLGFINIHAQNTDPKNSTIKGFNFAVKGGANFSKTLGDVQENQSFLTDFNIGTVVKIPTGLNFNIQAEPQLSRVGSSRDGKTESRFTFLDIPVLAQIHSSNNWSFEAGPKAAVTLSQKQRRQENLETVNRLKKVTLGLVGGATYNFDSNWFGQFRINYWLSDIIRDGAGDNEGTSILLFQFSIGYWFN